MRKSIHVIESTELAAAAAIQLIYVVYCMSLLHSIQMAISWVSYCMLFFIWFVLAGPHCQSHTLLRRMLLSNSTFHAFINVPNFGLCRQWRFRLVTFLVAYISGSYMSPWQMWLVSSCKEQPLTEAEFCNNVESCIFTTARNYLCG